MRYLDTGIVIGHILESEKEHKKCSAIIQAIALNNEKVIFSVFNIAEVFYILEREKVTLDRIELLIEKLVLFPGISLCSVSTQDALHAVKIAAKYKIDLTDAVSIILMKQHEIKEIYSLDSHFDKFGEIIRITEQPTHEIK